jgi:hypothetical protein
MENLKEEEKSVRAIQKLERLEEELGCNEMFFSKFCARSKVKEKKSNDDCSVWKVRGMYYEQKKRLDNKASDRGKIFKNCLFCYAHLFG